MDDNLFDALTSIHRRRILVALLDHNPQPAPDLTDGPWETPAEKTSLLTERHVHLPKLAEYGYIEWAPSEQEITRGPRFEKIRPVLELLDENQDELPEEWI